MFLGKKNDRDAAAIARIRKWEDEAEKSPDLYKRKVLAMAALGYGFPFIIVGVLAVFVVLGVLHLLNGGGGGSAILKLSFASIILAGIVIRSMFVRFEEPTARRLQEEDAPALFQAIDDIRVGLDAPAIDEVYIDDQLNASIEQTPRNGLLGGAVNRLTIGIPLLQALSAQQVKAVLAHEYGHIAGAHGKTGAWIYRTRVFWARLASHLDEHDTLLNLPLVLFYRAFTPFFEKMSFPLARANEYEADRASADLVDAQTAGDALVRIEIAARYLSEEFWPKVDERARTCDAPNVAPLKHSDKAFIRLRSFEKAEKWLEEALTARTLFEDTHPALADRLRALEATPRLAPLKGERATALLQPVYEEARQTFDRTWRESISGHWADAYKRAQIRLTRLADLDSRAKSGPLSPDEAFERGDLATEFASREAGIAAYKQAAIWSPEDARAFLQLGRLLAEDHNPRAEKCLKRAAGLEPRYALASISTLYSMYVSQGEHDKADAIMEDIRLEEGRHEQAEEEIATLSKKEPFKPHDLSAGEQQELFSVINELEGVKESFVVCKPTKVFAGYHGYHVIIVPESRDFDVECLNEALDNMDFRAPLFSWVAAGDLKWLAKKAREMDANARLEPIAARKAVAA